MNESSGLTPREQEILNLILDGISLKEIAGKLDVSYKAVDFHRDNLYRKLGIHSMQELMLLFANKEISESVIETDQNLLLPKEFIPALYKEWITSYDETSSVNISVKSKGLYIFSGTQGIEGGWAGALGFPDYDTGKAMKSMSMLSFKVLGDGNDYWIMFPTTETRRNNNYYGKPFSTQNGKITTITVNIKNELISYNPDNNPEEFIQSNVTVLEFLTFCKKSFYLMIWDINLYP